MHLLHAKSSPFKLKPSFAPSWETRYVGSPRQAPLKALLVASNRRMFVFMLLCIVLLAYTAAAPRLTLCTRVPVGGVPSPAEH